MINYELCALSFFAGLFIYNAHQLSDRNKKAFRLWRAWTHLSGFILLILLTRAPWQAQILGWPGLIMCFWYSRRAFIPFVGGLAFSKGLDLKRLSGIKAIWVALTVSLTVSYLPFAYSLANEHGATQSVSLTNLCLLFVNAFTLCWANATLFDHRDYKEDQRNGIASWPVVFGLSKSLKACRAILLGVMFSSTLAQFSVQSVDPKIWSWTLSLMLLYLASYLFQSRVKKAEWYDLLVDGCLFCPALTLLAGSF